MASSEGVNGKFRTPGAGGAITVTFDVTGSLEDVVWKLEKTAFGSKRRLSPTARCIVGFEDSDGNAMWLCEQSKGQAD